MRLELINIDYESDFEIQLSTLTHNRPMYDELHDLGHIYIAKRHVGSAFSLVCGQFATLYEWDFGTFEHKRGVPFTRNYTIGTRVIAWKIAEVNLKGNKYFLNLRQGTVLGTASYPGWRFEEREKI